MKSKILLLILTIISLANSNVFSQKELIVNGDFTQTNYGWKSVGNFYYDSRFDSCKSCPGYAYLSTSSGGVADNLFGYIYQQLTIPSSANSATLTFYTYIGTYDLNGANDLLRIYFVYNGSSTYEFTPSLSNLDYSSGYVKRSYNVPTFLFGTPLILYFQGSTNNNGLATKFRVDDVSLTYIGQQAQQYAISTSSKPSNGGSTSGGGNYNSGNTVTVSAAANSGWNFINWTENGNQVSANSTFSFTANSDRDLVANFSQQQTQQYTITTSPNPTNGGSTSGDGTYNSGSTVTVSAVANSGWNFINWTENGNQVSPNSTFSFTASSDRDFVANFSQQSQQYAISTSSNPSNGGSTSGGGNYNSGNTVTVAAAANSGWHFVDWTENRSEISSNATFSFTASSDRNLVANFSQQVAATYWIGAYCDPESHHNLVSGILAEATSYTPPAFPLKVCADGSDATVIQLNCDNKNLDMTKIRFRLASDQNQTNINLYGGFNNAYTSTNTLAETRLTHPNYLDNINGVNRNDKIQAYSIDDPQKKTIIELPIIVYRAPMLFVHGLWGDDGSFKDMDEYFQNQFGINIATFRADYKTSNANSFASNYFVILDNWQSAMAHAISLRFSCGKMDVIAHSMGGVLTRLFLQNHTYKGEVHTLTTINTPHSGTQAANLLLSSLGENTVEFIAHPPITFQGHCSTCGAVKDLEFNSSYFMNNLNGNNIKVPSLIYTSFDDAPSLLNESWIPIYVTYSNNISFFHSVGFHSNYDLTQGAYELDTSLFGQKLNDAIVPLPSQIGDVSNFDMAQEITHTDAESNKNIFDDLKNKLGQNPASFPFNNNGFAPTNLSMPSWFYDPRVTPDVNKIMSNDSIIISNPISNNVYNTGDTVAITIKNYANEHSFTGCFISDVDSMVYNNLLDDKTMSFQYIIPKNVYGKVYILAYGIEDNKPIYYDSVFVFVNTAAYLDSLKFEHKTIFISSNNSQSFSINGYYSDSIIRNVTNSPDINYNILDESVLSINSNNTLQALKVGSTQVIATMQGFVDTLNVIVYDAANGAYSAFTTNTNIVCGNGQVQFNEETAGNILNRQWLFSGGSPSNSTAQNPIVNYSSSGSYDVQLITTWADKKDTLLVPGYIKVQPATNAQINVLGEPNICEKDSAKLSANKAAYYFWSSGENTQNIYVKNAGSYYVTAIDSFGCSAISNTINISVNPKPDTKIIASGATTFCQGGNVILSASDTINSYTWSNGNTAQNINVNTSGLYKLISTNQFSCSSQDSVNITTNSLPEVNAGDNSMILYGDSVTTGGNPTASGNSPFIYQWRPVAGLSSSTIANPVASPDSTTTYTVNVTDKNSCANRDSLVVKIIKCTYHLSDSSIQFNSEGGQHILNVITNSILCQWQVDNPNDWIHIIPTGTQTGSGFITISVDNCIGDSARLGIFTVGDHVYTVIQQCQKPGFDFKVYPNPTNGKIVIAGKNIENNNYTITITDMAGKKMMNYSLPVSNYQLYKEINLHAYSNGSYLVQIQSTDFKKVYKIEKL
jgi:hypothetical protein